MAAPPAATKPSASNDIGTELEPVTGSPSPGAVGANGPAAATTAVVAGCVVEGAGGSWASAGAAVVTGAAVVGVGAAVVGVGAAVVGVGAAVVAVGAAVVGVGGTIGSVHSGAGVFWPDGPPPHRTLP